MPLDGLQVCVGSSYEDCNPPEPKPEQGDEVVPKEFEEQCIGLISRMEATQPRVIRLIRVFRVLQHGLWYGMRGRQDIMHDRSEEASEIDEFWSHSWQTSAWLKYMNILFLYNGFIACVVGTLVASVSFTLYILGVLPEFGEPPLSCRWCTPLGTAAYLLTLLLCERRAGVFLDIACIHQKDQRLKFEGVVSLGSPVVPFTFFLLWVPSKKNQPKKGCPFL